MRVTILGSGTAIPAQGRFPAGVLVELDDRVVLIDCGPGTLRRLADVGIGLERVTDVLLTHFHTDHCADLAALLFALRNPRYDQRPSLTVRAAAGLRDLVGHLTHAWPWLAPRGYALILQEIAPGVSALGEGRLTAVPVVHTPQSLAYRIDTGDAVVAVSGDADVCPGLAEVARGADWFVCEASFPDHLRQPGHLTPRLAGQAAAEAGARRLCLTHFYPECTGHDLAAEAATVFGGAIVLAHDLLRLEA